MNHAAPEARTGILAYYAQPGPLTTLPESAVVADLLAGLPELSPDRLPDQLPELVQCVRQNVLHIFWAERYGVTLSDARKAEVQIRSAAAMLDRIHAVDPSPLTVARPHAQKLVGNCRDFSVLTVALLRRSGRGCPDS